MSRESWREESSSENPEQHGSTWFLQNFSNYPVSFPCTHLVEPSWRSLLCLTLQRDISICTLLYLYSLFCKMPHSGSTQECQVKQSHVTSQRKCATPAWILMMISNLFCDTSQGCNSYLLNYAWVFPISASCEWGEMRWNEIRWLTEIREGLEVLRFVCSDTWTQGEGWWEQDPPSTAESLKWAKSNYRALLETNFQFFQV